MSGKSEATENYLKAVYQLGRESDGGPVSSGEIARRVGVAPATATLMLKRLADIGLVSYAAYSGVSLTSRGKQVALKMVRRHRLIELFLVQTLGMSWDQVHHEAELLEHAVTDGLIERIDEYLGHPNEDPHGSPIPRDDGTLPDQQAVVTLDACETGCRFTLRHVPEQSPDFLRYLTEVGLEVGASGVVKANCDNAGVVNLEVGSDTVVLSRQAASSLHVSLDR